MIGLQEIEDPQKRLDAITKYASAYWKIKQPNPNDCKGQRAQGATDAIYIISQIAIEEKNSAVVGFLSNQTNIIIERVLAKSKG